MHMVSFKSAWRRSVSFVMNTTPRSPSTPRSWSGSIAAVAGIVAFGLGVQATAQTVVTLTPSADTYTEQGQPTVNFGTATTVLIRRDPAGTLTRGGYFQFDLSGLPAGTISSATLRLFGSQDQGGAGITLKSHGGTAEVPWSETALTYNNSLTLTGVDFNSASLATVNVSPPPAAWYSWDVTSYIAGRRSLGHATIGVGYTTTDTYRSTFNSRQAATNRPQLVVTITASLPPQSWPMFGHDYSNTRTSIDTGINAANVGSLAVRWRSAGGGITATPTIADGIAYVSTFHGFVKAVRISDGSTLWQVQPSTSVTMLSPSPFVDTSTNRIYVAGNGGMVFALNRSTGATIWSRQIESTPNSRVSSSPIVVGNILIIGSGSYQVFVPATPMFRGKVVFLNASTGAPLNYITNMCPSTVCGGGISVWSTAAVDTATRTGYIGTGQAYAAPAGPYSDSLVAFNIDTGAIRWNYQFTANDVYTISTGFIDFDVGASPNLFTATIGGVSRQMVGVGDKGGRYAAFDRSTGQRMWITTIGTGTSIGGMMHSAAYNNGRIYVVNNQGLRGTGRNDPVPVPGVARALDAATGAVVWSTNLTQGGFGGVSIANGFMYFTTWDGRLHVLNANTGAIVKIVQVSPQLGSYVAAVDGFPNGSASGPVVYSGRVYVGYGWTWIQNIDGGLTAIGP